MKSLFFNKPVLCKSCGGLAKHSRTAERVSSFFIIMIMLNSPQLASALFFNGIEFHEINNTPALVAALSSIALMAFLGKVYYFYKKPLLYFKYDKQPKGIRIFIDLMNGETFKSKKEIEKEKND
jgi:hypothetical protein